MIAIPFSFLPPRALKKLSRPFFWLGSRIGNTFKDLSLYLDQANIPLNPTEYVSMCIVSNIFLFVTFAIFLSLILAKLGVNVLTGIGILFIACVFILSQQLMYPRLQAKKRIKDIERNLLPALQNMVVQLNSGVPLFNVIAIVSDSDYGGVSEQFKIAVRKINAGEQQIVVLEDLAKHNPSTHFRRTLWQIINGMKTGSDMADVIKLSIDTLSEEQLIQIQKYGSQLNPLAMFYMIIAVIIPALSITFIIIMSSFLSLDSGTTKLIFWGLLAVVFFFQFMFLGMLKMRRPNLLE